VLFNQNYAELPDSIPAGGHEKYTSDKLRYFIHEHCVNDTERVNFSRKYPGKMHCNYWPHFSLRPSLIKTSIFKHLAFEDVISFEQTFGLKYVSHRYCSAFLQGTRCKHIGRLTSDKTSINLNAYDLIAQPQFGPLKTFEAYVINLRRRTDRLAKFKDKITIFNFNINVYEAIDGKQLVPSPRLNALFEHNDYDMRRGIVGCALSHLKLWAQFYKNPTVNYYCIFEDDVNFHHEFEGSLNRVLSLASDNDIIFLGATPNPKCPPDYTTKQGVITVSASHSLNHYWGGAFGYLISFNGVKRMFDYIEKTTMTNAIDTMMQKASDVVKVAYVVPSICSAELASDDTDIQNDFNTDLKNGVKELGDVKIYNAKGVPDFDGI
jgi:GR25 family glycosyltransferase involved in LPS biosynthesis